MPTLTTLAVHQQQVRVPHVEAQESLDHVIGLDAVTAVARLRLGPGRTCEPVARVLDRAIADAGTASLDPAALIVSNVAVTPGENIVRVRRKAHGKADWITSVTSNITIELTPRGLHEAASARESAPGSATAATPTASKADPNHRLVPAIRDRLLDVIDPDLGINVVDLGFVRDVGVENTTAVLTMTLTSAACPLTTVMEDQIRTELLGENALVDDFRIDWEWAPAWTPAEITPDGREQLRAIGFTI